MAEQGDKVDGRIPETESEDLKYVYNMQHPKRGLAYIINNDTFERKTRMNNRRGSDRDAANLYQLFKSLGFQVELYNNLTWMDMEKLMAQIGQQDHTNYDCFACAVLSHGADQGRIYGTDGITSIDNLVAPFKGDKCPSLVGKPKLFFIQACRGDRLDEGVEVADGGVESDGGEDTRIKRIPTEADFLMAYSTVPGYYAWRNSTNGSWFVQAICQVFAEHAKSKDILSLMTRVNNKVAFEFESHSSDPMMDQMKQTPSIVSMLTKELYLHPK